MNWIEMNTAVNEAKAALDKADLFTNQMASMIKGKLRSGKVSPATLTAFKKELRDFNMQTYRWKD